MRLTKTRAALPLLALAAALALAGCGRKGALEPPGAAERQAVSPATVFGTAPRQAQPAEPERPKRPFFLDFLI